MCVYLRVFTASLQTDTTAQHQGFVHVDDVIGDDHARWLADQWPVQTGLHLLQPLTHRQISIQGRRGQTRAQTYSVMQKTKTYCPWLRMVSVVL